ncbi:MAG TPA: 1,2-phenylacetyl-CoA epoxidase subunit PaaC [Chitinophagaceae bacterium]|nr:1,2-phenylacetyl-CoA epoxidase subunit PaaC [Chitinophagaceae bacterium]
MPLQALEAPLRNLITKMADDELILGHRNSAWTGLGPILEEDIAFSSMAQDKIGHARTLYEILQDKFGETDPDHFAFLRKEKDFKCCHLVEMPIGEYDFSLMRHFLFDFAETVRYESLGESTFEPFRQLSGKIRGELKYHTLHAREWIRQLGTGTEESHIRMQRELENCFPFAAGIFEPLGGFEQLLIDEKIYCGEKTLYERWLARIHPVLIQASLDLPDVDRVHPVIGGRQGFHTEYLQPLLDEMSEVYRLDPQAEW